MIPAKVVLEGDRSKAERLRGFAMSQLQILHNAMKFQGLKQDTRMVRFSDGSWVKLVSNFGFDLITVFAPPVLVKEVGEELEWPEARKFYLRVKIDGNNLFYGGQKFVVKYTNILGEEIERGEEDALVRTVPGNRVRGEKGYTMNLVGPFVLEFEKADLGKPVYVGLLKERWTDEIEWPDGYSWGVTPGCYYVYVDWELRYYGLDNMFSYLVKDNDYGVFRTFVQTKESNLVVGVGAFQNGDCMDKDNEAWNRTWHWRIKGLTDQAAIGGGTVSPDKYKFLETIYKEISWADFIEAKKEGHITPDSEPKAEAIDVIDLDLAFGLKAHYTKSSYIHTECPCPDDNHLYPIPYPDEEIYTNCEVYDEDLEAKTSNGVPPITHGSEVVRYAHSIGYQKDTYDILDAIHWRAETQWRHCIDMIVGAPCPAGHDCRLSDKGSCYIVTYRDDGQAFIEVQDEFGAGMTERDLNFGYDFDYWLWWDDMTDEVPWDCTDGPTHYQDNLVGETRDTPTYWF